MKSVITAQIVWMILAVGLFTGSAFAAEGEVIEPATEPAKTEAAPQAAEQPTEVSAQPVPGSDEAAATAAMDDLLGSRDSAPVIEPNKSSDDGDEFDIVSPAASVDIDPAVLGIAPGDDPPPLRREGEFIVNRRGRMIRSAESGHRLFVFEADTQHTPELPLVMQACQLLETMENTVDRRGDSTVFILSGQVHTYRGANYLLPTMMTIAMDAGNLTN